MCIAWNDSWSISLKDSVLLIVRSIRSRKTPTTSPTCHCLPNVSAVLEYTFSSFKIKRLPVQHFRSWRIGTDPVVEHPSNKNAYRDTLLFARLGSEGEGTPYIQFVDFIAPWYVLRCRVRFCARLAWYREGTTRISPKLIISQATLCRMKFLLRFHSSWDKDARKPNQHERNIESETNTIAVTRKLRKVKEEIRVMYSGAFRSG